MLVTETHVRALIMLQTLTGQSSRNQLWQGLQNIMEFFLNRVELSLNSVKSANAGKLINH